MGEFELWQKEKKKKKTETEFHYLTSQRKPSVAACTTDWERRRWLCCCGFQKSHNLTSCCCGCVGSLAISTEALFFDTLPCYSLKIHGHRSNGVAQWLSSNSVPAVLEATITNMTSSDAEPLTWISVPWCTVHHYKVTPVSPLRGWKSGLANISTDR